MKAMLFCTDRHGARDALRLLLERGVEVTGCVFDEERPNRLSSLCEENGIPCYTTETLYAALKKGELPPCQVGISYLYHRLLREPMISFPKKGIINFHPAPVSVHKGVAACCYCLLQGYSEWAVTAHYVSTGIDEGDVIEERWFRIDGVETAIEMEALAQRHSLELFQEIIEKLLSNTPLIGRAQKPEEGIYFSRKDLEQIKDVSNLSSTEEIERRIHALWLPPYHGASIRVGGKQYTLVDEFLLKKLAEETEEKKYRGGVLETERPRTETYVFCYFLRRPSCHDEQIGRRTGR